MMKKNNDTTMRRPIQFVWLLVAFVLGSCAVDDGDTGASPGPFGESILPATYLCQWDADGAGSSTVTLSGNSLVIANPPEAYWASLAGCYYQSAAGEEHCLCFQLTHVGYSSQSNVYNLSSEPYDSHGAPYAVSVATTEDDGQQHRMTLGVSADSKLLVNKYNGTMALYLRLLSLSIDGEEAVRFGADGLLMMLSSTGGNHD